VEGFFTCFCWLKCTQVDSELSALLRVDRRGTGRHDVFMTSSSKTWAFAKYFCSLTLWTRWSQWLRGLRRRSAATRLLRSWVRIPPGGINVCRECCVLSGRRLYDELITRPEESYWLWSDIVSSRMRRPWPALCRSTTKKYIYIYIYAYVFTYILLVPVAARSKA